MKAIPVGANHEQIDFGNSSGFFHNTVRGMQSPRTNVKKFCYLVSKINLQDRVLCHWFFHFLWFTSPPEKRSAQCFQWFIFAIYWVWVIPLNILYSQDDHWGWFWNYYGVLLCYKDIICFACFSGKILHYCYLFHINVFQTFHF